MPSERWTPPAKRSTPTGTAGRSSSSADYADLTDTHLTDAYLFGANLSEADLERTNLSLADLSQVDLSRAKLVGARLSEVDLTGADLTGAIPPSDAAVPEGWKLNDQGRLRTR